MADLKRQWQFGVLLVTGFAVSGLNPTVADDEAAPAGHVSIRGVIVDANGQPLAGARVVLRDAAIPPVVQLIEYADVIAETKSDADGKFSFDRAEVPARMPRVVEALHKRQRGADIVVLAEGHGMGWVPIVATDDTREVEVVLNGVATLEGVVSDSEGAPLAKAQVEVQGISRLDAPADPLLRGSGDLQLYSSSIRPRTVTDDKGRFHIEQLPADCRLRLYVLHPDGQAQHLMAATSDELTEPVLRDRLRGENHEMVIQTNPVQVRLESGVQLRMQIVADETGKPISGGRLIMSLKSGWWKARVGPDGKLAVTVPEPGDYSVYYFPPQDSVNSAFNHRVKMTEAHAASPHELVFRMPAVRWLKGRVVGEESDAGLAGLKVVWRRDREQDTDPSYSARTVTGSKGQFRVAALPGSGKLRVDGQSAGYFIPSQYTMPNQHAMKVEVPEKDDAPPLQIELRRGLVVRGSVVDAEGEVVPRATIRASSIGEYGPHDAKTVTDDEGRFEISGLNPRERYDLSADSRSGVAFQKVDGDDSHSLDETREVTIEMQLQSTVPLRGRVFHGDKPLAQVLMTLYRGRDDGMNRMIYRPADEAITDTEGRYELVGLRPGDHYQIQIHPPFPALDPDWLHQSPYVQTLAANAKDQVDLPDIHLFATSQDLAGIVEDPHGNPVAGAKVRASINTGRSTETGKDGRFRLTQLPNKPLELMAYIRSKGDNRIRFPARVKCELNQQDIRIVLDPSLLEED